MLSNKGCSFFPHGSLCIISNCYSNHPIYCHCPFDTRTTLSCSFLINWLHSLRSFWRSYFIQSDASHICGQRCFIVNSSKVCRKHKDGQHILASTRCQKLKPKYPECAHLNLEAFAVATGGRDMVVPLHLLQNTEQDSAAHVFHISLLLHQMTN